MVSLLPLYFHPYLIWVSQQGSQSDTVKVLVNSRYSSSSNTSMTSELFQSKGPNPYEDVQSLWHFCSGSTVLPFTVHSTPALPPSFQFPHTLIHSEPLYLFILVVRMPFLKYLYREDISLSFSRCRLSLRLPLFKDSLITVLSLLPDILISLFFCMIITRTVYFLTLHISH